MEDSAPGVMLTGRRLLVVDDSPVNRGLAKLLLEDEGAVVTLARNGREGVELLRASPGAFDVVLMDVQMPEMDGLDATRIIRGELGLHALRIIALTASEQSSEKDAALQAGMNEFIAKPLELEPLMNALGERGCAQPGTEPPPEVAGLDSSDLAR